MRGASQLTAYFCTSSTVEEQRERGRSLLRRIHSCKGSTSSVSSLPYFV